MSNGICRLLAMLLVGTVTAAQAQTPASAGSSLIPNADDERRASELAATGERRAGKLVVLFTPAGAIADGDEAALVERLDKGVAALHSVVGRHDWQVQTTPTITFYVHQDRFPAHAFGRGVFIPLAHVEDGHATFLHEAAYELLRGIPPGDTVPTPWLTTGLANYVALTAAELAAVPEEHVFGSGQLIEVDALCSIRSKEPRGAEILPFIGRKGVPRALFTDEVVQVAPAFYACATSFTKHLVARVGLPAVIGLMPLLSTSGDVVDTNRVLRTIEELTGGSMDALLAEWRASIDRH